VRRRQQQRSGADGELTSSLLNKAFETTEQNVINGVSEMKASVSSCMQQREMSIGVAGLIMALMENAQAPATEVVSKGHQRRSVQQQPLTMNVHRPAGIRAEEQWILDQHDRAPGCDRWMVSEQLVRKNKGDVHLRWFHRQVDRRVDPGLWQDPGPPVRLSD